MVEANNNVWFQLSRTKLISFQKYNILLKEAQKQADCKITARKENIKMKLQSDIRHERRSDIF